MGKDASSPATPDELLSAAKEYAQTVPITVSLDELQWTVSNRAKRRAGAVKVRKKLRTEEIEVDLNWIAYKELGWETFEGVIRHELIHVWQFEEFGAMNHGASFNAKAEELDAPRHCTPFIDHRYELECATCGKAGHGRHQRSKVVKYPENYRHPACNCGVGLRVFDTKTGTQWTTHHGFVDAFDDVSKPTSINDNDRYRLECADCGMFVGRRKIRSAPVQNPSRYACNQCDCPEDVGLRVIDTENDESWI